eukprot:6461173-Amphidinium_carterae.2
MKVWRAGRLAPKITTRDLGVDAQWVAWRCPVQRKVTYQQSVKRLWGGTEWHMSASQRSDVRISARKPLGNSKGARLRRSSPLELMAYGGPAGDPQITAP